MRIAPTTTPGRLPAPPRITMAYTVISVGNANAVGKTPW